MPTYSNIHAHLDNSELHPPRDFSLAHNDTVLGKSPYGELTWYDTYWQHPVKDLLDGGLTPPAGVHGDRYVLLGMGTTTFCGTALHDVVVSTTVDGTAIDTTVQEPYDVYGTCANVAWNGAQLNDIVEYFALDKDGLPINKWMAVTPLQGYMVNDLHDGDIWRFNGAAWEQQKVAEAPNISYAMNLSYADMQALITAQTLRKGEKYWINDKRILLEAVNEKTLSMEGDYTQEIKAYATVDITARTSGTVDSISANGTELIPSPVAFNTDLNTTAGDVVTAINSGTGTHGYTAKSALSLVILFAPTGLGADANGYAVAATATGMSASCTNFTNGQNVGTNWFGVRYRFAEDVIVEMSDNKGNHVIQPMEGVSFLSGFNAINEFPWGYANVFGNLVSNGLLMAHAATGNICNNQVYGFMNAMGYTGPLCKSNTVSAYYLLSLQRATGRLGTNVFELGGLMSVDESSGGFFGNHINGGNFYAQKYSGSNCVGNICVDSEITLNGSSFDFRVNKVSHSTVNASNASCDFEYNTITAQSTLTVDNATGQVTCNEISASTVNLGGFTGTSFQKNRVFDYNVSATGSTGNIHDNIIEGGGIITMNNYATGEFRNNHISGYTTFTANAASGNIFENKIHASVVELTNYAGTQFTRNNSHFSTITANNCTGIIEANILNLGTIEAVGASGNIETNTINSYAVLKLNGFTGEKFIKSVINDSSILNCENSANQQGAIVILGNSEIDISSTGCVIYQLHTFLPNQSIKLNSTLLGLSINAENSNYQVSTSIDSSGILDLDQDYMRFAGIVEINNSGTLKTIKGLSTMPHEFILKPAIGAFISMDNTSATNLIFPSGISSFSFAGNGNSFLKFNKDNPSISALLLEAYIY